MTVSQVMRTGTGEFNTDNGFLQMIDKLRSVLVSDDSFPDSNYSKILSCPSANFAIRDGLAGSISSGTS